MDINEFKTEFNDDLDGYIITFKNADVAHTQMNTQDDKLHANYGYRYLARYTEYDSNLTEKQSGLVDEFVCKTNRNLNETQSEADL